jgi:hypothetical protein
VVGVEVNGYEIGPGADLSGANLREAKLAGVNLEEANLTGANLTGADLSLADLYEANLTGADLSGADLSDADLCDANLTGANLYGAFLAGAIASENTIWPEGFDPDVAEVYEIGPEADLKGANLEGATWHRPGNRRSRDPEVDKAVIPPENTHPMTHKGTRQSRELRGWLDSLPFRGVGRGLMALFLLLVLGSCVTSIFGGWDVTDQPSSYESDLDSYEQGD